MKKIAIVQSFYIPWKGYFDIINTADEFILFDDMQYPRRHWANRNKIKTPQGAKWITIPVKVKGKFHQAIKDTKISDSKWNIKHWETIKRNYAQSEYFKEYEALFEDLYLGCREEYLSLINYRFISNICRILGIKTKLSWSIDYKLIEGKTERLIYICQQAGAQEYITGPSARDYIQEELFQQAGIKLTYMDYSGYPEYRQLHPPFVHQVSIVDMIFNEGPFAAKFMKSFDYM